MVKVYRHIPLPEPFSVEQHTFIPDPLPDIEIRLYRLAQAIHDDLNVLNYPSRTWNYARSPGVLEVAIIGAGQSGKSIAFGLRRYGINNVRIFDCNTKGNEGPWRGFARNHTLRTPKVVTGGLDWGIPNLNFQRWCIASYGQEYYQEMKFIPRSLWANYLDWYSDILNLPIQHQTLIENITWDATQQHFCLHSCEAVYHARFVILATGLDHVGGKFIPQIVQETLPEDCYAHTSDEIDFASLANKRVVVLGGGASAFDNANLALAANAKQVDLVIRRPQIPNINRIRWSEWNGYHRHFVDLNDSMKWYYTLEEICLGQLPPAHTYGETVSNPAFTLYTEAPLTQLQFVAGEIIGCYGDREMSHDFLICGTGFKTRVTEERELRSLSAHIALWNDRYQPEPGSENNELANYPYLGNHFEFQPKANGHGYLRRIYYLSSAVGWLSGFRAYLSGLQFAAPRVCYDISRQLFLEHQPEIRAAFDRYDVEDFPAPKISNP